MERKTKSGTTITTSLIPEKFAKVGQYLELQKAGGEWENGWKVMQTGAKVTDKEVNDRQRLYLKHREATDI